MYALPHPKYSEFIFKFLKAFQNIVKNKTTPTRKMKISNTECLN